MKQKKSIKIKRKKFYTGIFAKLFLEWQGKRDGKNEIPSLTNGNNIISPNLKKEHEKIHICMAYITKCIDVYNSVYYQDLKSMIADFCGKVADLEKIQTFLNGVPSDTVIYIPSVNSNPIFETYLASKRNSENNLDNIVVRKRRFDEYQHRIDKYRAKRESLRIKIDELYISIMTNFECIMDNIDLVEPVFWQISSNIEIRTSYYWQGVLLKHPESEKLPKTPPEPNNNKYRDYYKKVIDEITKEITNVKSRYDQVIK